MKRIVLRFFALVLFLAVATAAAAWRAWSPGAPSISPSEPVLAMALPDRFRTPEEHDAVVRQFGRPYVLDLDSGNGRLLFYGAKHVREASDPQLADIERRWNELKPTAALTEGRSRGYFLGPLFGRLEEASEPALVHRLARRDGVPIYSLEPSYEDEVRALLGSWTPEQIALYFTMRVYWSEAGGRPDDDLATHLLQKRTEVEGLRGSIATVADIDRIWNRDFPQHGDWRSWKGEPPEGSYLRAIGDDSRRVRGEHMARVVIDLTERGERVMAVVGSGHVIRLERIVRKALGTEVGSGKSEV